MSCPSCPSCPLLAKHAATSSIGTFSCNSKFAVTNSGSLFIDLANSISCFACAANYYISSIVSVTLSDCNFFQIPYIISALRNLENGKYTESSVTENGIVITTYLIPYSTDLLEKTITLITYFNNLTNILFYEIPREFSYNSKEQSSVAITFLEDGSFPGKIFIPASFTSTREQFLSFIVTPQAIPSVTQVAKTLAAVEISAIPSNFPLPVRPCSGNNVDSCYTPWSTWLVNESDAIEIAQQSCTRSSNYSNGFPCSGYEIESRVGPDGQGQEYRYRCGPNTVPCF